jgi:hypothetical protein
MELVVLYWMHGVQKTFHGFLKMGNSSIAFVQSPEIGEIQPQKGVSHPSWTAAPVAAGVMQHLAPVRNGALVAALIFYQGTRIVES